MDSKNPIITVRMQSGGSFAFELYPAHAPNACNSVINLALAGAYDNMTIDRIVPGFVVQPRYADEGRPDLDFSIAGEFAANGFACGLPIQTGMVAMAGDGAKAASGSAFFFTMGEHPRLVDHYTVIGKVIEGWDEVKRLEAVETAPVDIGVPGVSVNAPVVPEIMEKVTVETFGVAYPAVIKLAE